MIYISWPLPVVADLAITKGYMRQTLPVSIKIKHHLHVQEITGGEREVPNPISLIT